jgi:hypothetical protein
VKIGEIDGWSFFRSKHKTPGLERGCAEVNQERPPIAGGFEVIQDLGFFIACQGAQRFQLDDHISKTDKVCTVLTRKRFPLIGNRYFGFANERDGAQGKFKG